MPPQKHPLSNRGSGRQRRQMPVGHLGLTRVAGCNRGTDTLVSSQRRPSGLSGPPLRLRLPRRAPLPPRCKQELPPPPPQRWGNNNRLSPGSGPSGAPPAAPAGQRAGGRQRGDGPLEEFLGRLSYRYYNWRQDTSSDLQLFIVNNIALFFFLGWVEQNFIRPLDESSAAAPGAAAAAGGVPHWYGIAQVVLGQDLPVDGGLASQLFSVAVAVLGLASFALVLALIEQVVLEVLESNVKRGSAVYEEGHTVVLAWCESARDVGQVTRILTELCQAYRSEGGTTVVVLTQREKLEMEGIFREGIPPEDRHGTQFVFRQGSPLEPAALQLVAAAAARAIIISGDYSRTSLESDALVLRTAVLLDELVAEEAGGAGGPGAGGGPVVVAQVKTSDGLPLLLYSCSQRVIPVPTSAANALRFARLLRHPIVAVFSHMLTDHASTAHGGIASLPELEGERFKDVQFRLPHAVVLGLMNSSTGYCQLNPPPDRVLGPGDEVVMLRPGTLSRQYRPLEAAVRVDPGPGWSSQGYSLQSQDDQPLGLENCYCNPAQAPSPSQEQQQAAGYLPLEARNGRARPRRTRRGPRPAPAPSASDAMYCLPLSWDVLSDTLLEASELLICGWAGDSSMWELLRQLDHGRQPLPGGSQVTLVNTQPWEAVGGRLAASGIRHLRVAHVQADPRNRMALSAAIDITRYKAAIVVCDVEWTHIAKEGGPRMSQGDMLRLDAAVLMVQLNLRVMLEEAGRRNVTIITEKLTYTGVTRYEDPRRLPLGISVNTSSFSARLLTQVACEPRFLKPYLALGEECDIVVQDAAGLAAPGEALSYWQLQARAASVRQVLMGFYRIPSSPGEPLEVVVNPQGDETRAEVMVFNRGDARCKLITLAQKALIEEAAARSTASVDGLDGAVASVE